MQKVPKNIDLIVYRFVHRDLMKQLILEYHIKVQHCICENAVCTRCITLFIGGFGDGVGGVGGVTYNYRHIYNTQYMFVYNKFNCRCGKIPKKY